MAIDADVAVAFEGDAVVSERQPSKSRNRTWAAIFARWKASE